ncbi:FecCD family ABC transporter permease [Asaia astilbis]|uniref:FecCD family ABC transporter permease n=1 Tax=Asaia astilbis TaxID=610244 RepID=UPI000472F33B|nr:iron ABC transporter permease [Asaia astilbis]
MRERLFLVLAFGTLTVVFCASLLIGRYSINALDLLHVLQGRGVPAIQAVLFQARLPRLVAALFVGAALAVSGTTFQAVFRNPLVSPDLLGVLSGSAFGAAFAILVHGGGTFVGLAAFFGGCCAVALGFAIARLVGREGVLPLLLGGLISSALFTALLSLLKYLADPFDQLPAIIYWLLGSLAQTQWGQLGVLVPLLALGMLVLWRSGRVLDTFALSDDEAHSLGLPIGRLRLFVLVIATGLGALTVSLAGIIGWVGLIVPHMARLLIGPAHRLVLPFAALLGASCLILADTASRSLASSEIPLGMMTELFGALGFILVLRQLRREGRL